MAKKVKTLETTQSVSPPAYFGQVKVIKDEQKIIKLLGESVYLRHFDHALEALYPGEDVLLTEIHPVLSFTTKGHATLWFYNTLDVGKLDEPETLDVRSWSTILQDAESLFSKARTLLNWR